MAGVTWKKNTLYKGIQLASKDLESKQIIALQRAIEVMKNGFGTSGLIPVVSGRLKGSLLGKLAYEGEQLNSKEGDIIEMYVRKGSTASVTWGSNVEYAMQVELFSRLHKNFFLTNWNQNVERVKEVIRKALDLKTNTGIIINRRINT